PQMGFAVDVVDRGGDVEAHGGVSLEEPLLPLGSAPWPRDPGRLGERLLDVGADRALAARGDDRLVDALDVDVGAPPLARVLGIQRDEGVDSVGTGKLPVTQRHHAWLALGHLASTPR